MKDEREAGKTEPHILIPAEFKARFPDDEACFTYLATLRWPDGFVCPACGHTGAWTKTRRRLACSGCRRETTITAGTLFDGTHEPLRTWFAAIWHILESPGGVSAREFQEMLGLGNYKTARVWLRRLQRAMVPSGRDLLAGRVEVDDFRLPGRGSSTGETALAGTVVVVAVEARGEFLGRARIARVSDLSRDTLTEFVRSAIDPGATICTDDFEGYSGLEAAGFKHHVVPIPNAGPRPQISFASVRQVALALAQWLHAVRSVRLTQQTLDYRLDEFTFRFNHREASEGAELFRVLLAEIAKGNEGKGRRLPADV